MNKLATELPVETVFLGRLAPDVTEQTLDEIGISGRWADWLLQGNNAEFKVTSRPWKTEANPGGENTVAVDSAYQLPYWLLPASMVEFIKVL